MHRPAYNALKKSLGSTGNEAQAIIFVADRKQARLTALDMITFAASEAVAAD